MNSFKFFENKSCRFFPCHENGGGSFNCLFCYCPLYALGDRCGGDFIFLENGVKSCEKCLIPHSDGGYEFIMKRINKVIEMANHNF